MVLARARIDAAAGARSASRRSRPSDERGSLNMRSRSTNELAASGFGSMKMWRWSKAATRRMCRDSSMPLPNTSPDMSPMPTQVKSSLWLSRPSARKWRLTDSQAPLRGDAHALVVVADRTAGGERVAEPEAVLGADCRWRCPRRSRCPCRRRPPGRDRRRRGGPRPAGGTSSPSTRLSVMSSRPLMNMLVAGHAFGQHGIALAAGRRPLDEEAALGADRHDHRVLDHLRLDQAQYFGAEILAPVRPAQAAARDRAEAQVHAFDARRVDEDLAVRARLRQVRHAATDRT